MSLQAQAWRLREAARQSIQSGNPARAQQQATEAQEICYTQAGRQLQALSKWLAEQPQPAAYNYVAPITPAGLIDPEFNVPDPMGLHSWPFSDS